MTQSDYFEILGDLGLGLDILFCTCNVVLRGLQKYSATLLSSNPNQDRLAIRAIGDRYVEEVGSTLRELLLYVLLVYPSTVCFVLSVNHVRHTKQFRS